MRPAPKLRSDRARGGVSSPSLQAASQQEPKLNWCERRCSRSRSTSSPGPSARVPRLLPLSPPALFWFSRNVPQRQRSLIVLCTSINLGRTT